MGWVEDEGVLWLRERLQYGPVPCYGVYMDIIYLMGSTHVATAFARGFEHGLEQGAVAATAQIPEFCTNERYRSAKRYIFYLPNILHGRDIQSDAFWRTSRPDDARAPTARFTRSAMCDAVLDRHHCACLV